MFPREDRDHLRQCPLCACPCGDLTVLLWHDQPCCPTCYWQGREKSPQAATMSRGPESAGEK